LHPSVVFKPFFYEILKVAYKMMKRGNLFGMMTVECHLKNFNRVKFLKGKCRAHRCIRTNWQLFFNIMEGIQRYRVEHLKSK